MIPALCARSPGRRGRGRAPVCGHCGPTTIASPTAARKHLCPAPFGAQFNHIIGQRVAFDDVAHHGAEHAARAAGAGFLEQGVKRDLPFRLSSAMFAHQFVKPPFERAAQAEVIAAEGEHRAVLHRAEQPVRQGHHHADHAPALAAPFNLPAFDQAKAGGRLMRARGDIGGDARAGQPLKGVAQTFIAVTGGFAVGGHQQVVGLEVHLAADGAACVQGRDQLADAIDQDVLVVQRGAAFDGWDDLDLCGPVGVAQDRPVGPRGERKQRVFQRRQIALGQGVENIADKEIRRRVPLGQQGGCHGMPAFLRRPVCRGHPLVKSCLRIGSSRFVPLRGFSDT